LQDRQAERSGLCHLQKESKTQTKTGLINFFLLKLKHFMPRIAGVSIPDNKRMEVAITYIYGVGRSLAKTILSQSKIDIHKKAKDLTAQEINSLREIIEKQYKIEGDLRRQVMVHIKRLKDIGAWRGLRHIKKLPVRGQRTKTNTRTVRGNVRKTMGSGRKPAASPT
jgi:small subunit ribosomal protein S13